MQSLKGQVAVVAGATRGAGRGIACMLGEAGAIVYCSGRSTRGEPATGTRPETIEDTAEMVDALGGKGIPVKTDHTDENQVKALFDRIKLEQSRLDIVVNDIWGGDELAEWGKPFWELPVAQGLEMQRRGVFTHIITSRYAIPLMLEQHHGLIIEITDGDNFSYRGNFYYDLAKVSVIRLAFSLSQELKLHNITTLALTPGFLRSEAVLDILGVTEQNWREGAKKDPHFIASETPFFIGKAVAKLAADPYVSVKNGMVLSSWGLAEEYDFNDKDGTRPNWGKYFKEKLQGK